MIKEINVGVSTIFFYANMYTDPHVDPPLTLLLLFSNFDLLVAFVQFKSIY